jgi:hypothetical protein
MSSIGVRNDSQTVDAREGAQVAPRVTPKKALHVNLRDNDGNEINTPP